MYPTCIKSFKKFLKTDVNYINIYNDILKKPRIFDVSLRDGLQSIKIQDIKNYDLETKKKIYYDILDKHGPMSMEVGSYVSTKILPIFNDTIDFMKHLENIPEKGVNPEIYLFVPSFEKITELEKNHGDIFQFCNNFSLITSCSFGFQIKNSRKTLNESKNELSQIIKFLNLKKGVNNFKIKLYISCINECPVNGKMDIDYIVDEIMYYYMNYKLDNICLSDTMGTLSPEDFEKIMQKSLYLGLNSSFVSLHVHLNDNDTNDEKRVEQIINIALRCKIQQYDVSELKTGGCPILIEKNLQKSNLTYEIFYKCLVNNIVSIANNSYPF